MNWVGPSLSLLLLVAELFSNRKGVPLIQDVGAIALSVALLYILYQDRRNSSRLRLIGTLAALSFFGLWWSRWLSGVGIAERSPHLAQDRAYLQLGSILACSIFLSVNPSLRKGWQKLDITPGRKILGAYLLACAVGTAFLILPWTHQAEQTVPLIDAFFISVSALSVTGLSPIDIATHFNTVGLIAILALIQIGGWGVVAVSVALATLTRNRLSISESQMGLELYDIPELGKFSNFLLRVMLLTFLLETLGAISIFCLLPSSVDNALFHSIFLAISAFCNAGFSSIPGNLENPITLGARFPIGILIVVGGIGFPILFEAGRKAAHFIRGPKPTARIRFSPYFVLTVAISAALLMGGWASLILTERFNIAPALRGWDQWGQTLFYSISARTAGFNIIPVEQLAMGSQLILVLLMVIGGSPVSTAGGIKTTTAGVIGVAVWSFLRGDKFIHFLNREISPMALQKAVTIIGLYMTIAFFSLLVLLTTENLAPWNLTFEIVSALSTTGLSVGSTSSLQIPGKLIISALMLIGRIGLVTVALASMGRRDVNRYRYPIGHFYIG